MIIQFERERLACLGRDLSRLRLRLTTLCNGRICIGMCETFSSIHHIPSSVIMQLVMTRAFVVLAFMMQLISIVVDECVVTSNNAI